MHLEIESTSTGLSSSILTKSTQVSFCHYQKLSIITSNMGECLQPWAAYVKGFGCPSWELKWKNLFTNATSVKAIHWLIPHN